MKHVQIFENYEDSSNLGQGPFLVMYYNLERGEKEPLGIFSTLQKAEEFVWDKTKEEVGTYRKDWDQFLDELSGGLVQSTSELEEKLDELEYVECYYEILENNNLEFDGGNGKDMMKKVSDQWQVMAKNLE